MNSNDPEKPEYIPHLSPSFFDDEDLDKPYDFTPITESLNVPKTSFVYDRFTMINLKTSQTIQGWFGLFENYVVHCTMDNGKLKCISFINADKARVVRKKEEAKDNRFSFILIKNGVGFQFIAEKEESIDNWITSLKLISLYTNFHEEYEMVKLIGEGAFSKVCLVEHKQTKIKYAVKAFSKTYVASQIKDRAKECLANEINIMKGLSHKNIVTLYDIHETENSMYFVLDYIEGRNLEDIIKENLPYNEVRLKKIMRGILEGLSFLASKRIMHRDMKPENILIDKQDNAILIDFGLATFIDEEEYILPRCGTPGYISPEVFRYYGGGPKSYYTDKCDVFSFGCIVFYMLFGKKFFNAANTAKILDLNRDYNSNNESFTMISEELSKPISQMPKDALDLLLRLLEYDPKRRPSAAKALETPFLSGGMSSHMRKTYCSENDIRFASTTTNFVAKKINFEKNEQKASNNNITAIDTENTAEKNTGLRRSLYLNTSDIKNLGSSPKIVSSLPKSLKGTPALYRNDSNSPRNSKFSGHSIEEKSGDSTQVIQSKQRRNSLLKATLINQSLKRVINPDLLISDNIDHSSLSPKSDKASKDLTVEKPKEPFRRSKYLPNISLTPKTNKEKFQKSSFTDYSKFHN